MQFKKLTDEHAKSQEKRSPKPVLLFHEWRPDDRKRSHLNAEVINGIYAMVRDGWIYDDALSRFF